MSSVNFPTVKVAVPKIIDGNEVVFSVLGRMDNAKLSDPALEFHEGLHGTYEAQIEEITFNKQIYLPHEIELMTEYLMHYEKDIEADAKILIHEMTGVMEN